MHFKRTGREGKRGRCRKNLKGAFLGEEKSNDAIHCIWVSPEEATIGEGSWRGSVGFLEPDFSNSEQVDGIGEKNVINRGKFV